MRVLYVISFIVLVIGLCSCGYEVNQKRHGVSSTADIQEDIDLSSQLKEPPDIYFEYNNKRYLTVRGTTSWFIDNGDGRRTGFDCDSPGPDGLIRDQMEVISVAGLEEIEIAFDVLPDKYSVHIWNDFDDTEVVAIENNIIIIPDDRDSVIYEIHAYWDQGNAYYVIEVLIE